MFIRLNLLRVHHNFHGHAQPFTIKWPKKFINSNTILWSRHCCDIKRNEDLLLSSHGGSTITIPTPLKIKQTIKSGFHDFIDGFTCIQTTCPTCPKSAKTTTGEGAIAPADPSAVAQPQTGDKCLFINKTTGKFSQFIFKKKIR